MQLVSALFLFGALQGVFLVLALLTKAKKRINSQTFLIAFLILNVGFLIHQFAVIERWIEVYPHSIGAYVPLLFLLPPLFYLYVTSSINQIQVDRKTWLHALPFLLITMAMVPYYTYSAQQKLELLFADGHSQSLYPNRELIGVALFVSGLIYALLSISVIRNVKSRNVKWLRRFTYGFLILNTCLLVAMLFMNYGILNHRITISSSVIIFSLFIHFIGYAALMNPSIILPKNGTTSFDKTSNSQRLELKSHIIELFEKDKIYLQNDFSIHQLSQLLSSNSKYVSSIINQEFGCSFTFLLNNYRVEEAKKIMLDTSYDHLNFLGIASAVGFNNKNSFTRAFKRHLNQTPSEFRSLSKAELT